MTALKSNLPELMLRYRRLAVTLANLTVAGGAFTLACLLRFDFGIPSGYRSVFLTYLAASIVTHYAAIYVFKPTKALAGGSIYSATVSGDVKDVEGNPLGQPYTWKFSTIAPQIEYVSPGSGQSLVPLETPITVTFNHLNNGPFNSRIVFELNDMTLVAAEWDPESYGTDPLKLIRQ